MSCDPTTLLSDAKCFLCLTQQQLLAVQALLLCQISQSGVLFASTSSAGPAGTTDETNIIGSGVGSLTIPANSVSVGSTFRITMQADWDTTGSNLLELLAIRMGGDHLVSGSVPLIAANQLAFVSLTVLFTFRSIGVAGSLAATVSLTVAGTYDPGEILENRPNPLTVNTTQSMTISATAILSSDLSSFRCHNFVIERL